MYRTALNRGMLISINVTKCTLTHLIYGNFTITYASKYGQERSLSILHSLLPPGNINSKPNSILKSSHLQNVKDKSDPVIPSKYSKKHNKLCERCLVPRKDKILIKIKI